VNQNLGLATCLSNEQVVRPKYTNSPGSRSDNPLAARGSETQLSCSLHLFRKREEPRDRRRDPRSERMAGGGGIMRRRGMAAVLVLAAAIRLSIFSSAELREAIAARVEVLLLMYSRYRS